MNDLEYQKTDVGRNYGALALVLGILAFAFAFMPWVGMFAIGFAVCGVFLSLVGIFRAKNANGRLALLVSSFVISLLSGTLITVYFLFFLPKESVPSDDFGFFGDKHPYVSGEINYQDSLAIDSVLKQEMEITLEKFERELN